MRRVLMYPSISTKHHVWRESDFIVYWQIAQAMPDVFVYLLLNKEAKIPDNLKLPNMEPLLVADWVPFSMAQAGIAHEALKDFHPLTGKYHVDAVIMSQSASGAHVKRLLDLDENCHVPVLIIEPKASDFAGMAVTNDLDLSMRSLSYSHCPTMFGTTREKSIAMGAATRYLSAASLKRMDEICLGRSQGVPLRHIAQKVKEVSEFENFTLMFAARFNSNKRWDSVLGVFEKFCQMNQGVEGRAITPSVPLEADQAKMSHFQKTEIHTCLPVDEYIEMLCRSHVFVSMSIEEGFAAGWAEQIATGKPVLFPRKPWAKTLMPFDEYDMCFYNNEKELYALLQYVKDNYETVVQSIGPAVEKFIDRNDIAVAAKEIEALADKYVEGSFVELKGWHDRLLTTLGQLPDEFTMVEAIKAAKKNSIDLGCSVRQFSAVSAYRNLYFWLCDHAKPQMTIEMRFKKHA